MGLGETLLACFQHPDWSKDPIAEPLGAASRTTADAAQLLMITNLLLPLGREKVERPWLLSSKDKRCLGKALSSQPLFIL